MRPGVSALSAEEKQAEKSKLEGNECFRKNRFQAAIDAYTEVFSIYVCVCVIFIFFCLLIFFVLLFIFVAKAITLCPKVPIYWTNRALCHRKRKYVNHFFSFLG